MIAPRPGVSDGFTLVEILVSVIIISLGLVSAIYLQTMSIKQGSKADYMTVASLLAESEIERLRTFVGFNEIPDAVVAGVENLTREGLPCGADTGACFARVTELTEKTPTKRSHTVKVTVSWKGAAGADSVVYEAILTDINLGNTGA